MKGGFFSFKSSKGKKQEKIQEKRQEKRHYSFDEVVKNTKKSEAKLIKSYQDMDDITRLYTKAYVDHLENLNQLDKYAHFNGMVTLFEKVIMRDNIKTGNINTANPLFFRNYMVEGEVMPSVLREEHLKRQIEYFREKYFSSRDNAFINYITITEITKTSFVFNVIMIDNKKYNRKISHEDYLINKSEFKSALKDIIHTTKKNLKRDSRIIEYNEDTNNSYHKSRSVKSNRSGKRKDSNKSKKQRANSRVQNNKKQEQEINIFGKDNKKGIDNLDNEIKNLLRSKTKKRSLFSMQKTHSIRDREAKEKREAEEKAKLLANPPSQDEIIEKKCNLLSAQECALDRECFFNLGANKCKKSTRTLPMPGVQQALQPIMASPGFLNLDVKTL
jgi:hypothetical protein